MTQITEVINQAEKPKSVRALILDGAQAETITESLIYQAERELNQAQAQLNNGFSVRQRVISTDSLNLNGQSIKANTITIELDSASIAKIVKAQAGFNADSVKTEILKSSAKGSEIATTKLNRLYKSIVKNALKPKSSE